MSLHKTNVSVGCRLFGHCRQAYYQFRSDFTALYAREMKIVECINEIRGEDPGIGGYKLWVMLKSLLGDEIVPGRDSFYHLLRRHCLMLPPPKARHTTNSNHRFHKWKNKIKGFVPTAPNQLWVSDITYISLEGGDVCYLHLVTDAYSHKIIGWALADSLRAVFTMDALLQAISQAKVMYGSENLNGLIHHSDRGVQYCCDSYVNMLQRHNITISMTEDYKPTDNAIAERVNGIIKVESVYRRKFTDIDHARSIIGKYIDFYNNRRPHMSIGLKVPSQAHKEVGEQKKTWNNKKKYNNVSKNGGKVLPLPSRTTCPGKSESQLP